MISSPVAVQLFGCFTSVVFLFPGFHPPSFRNSDWMTFRGKNKFAFVLVQIIFPVKKLNTEYEDRQYLDVVWNEGKNAHQIEILAGFT
jgi:hypothetical protein